MGHKHGRNGTYGNTGLIKNLKYSTLAEPCIDQYAVIFMFNECAITAGTTSENFTTHKTAYEIFLEETVRPTTLVIFINSI
jgi:hypothetical protein